MDTVGRWKKRKNKKRKRVWQRMKRKKKWD
jgi:hypothetical protein